MNEKTFERLQNKSGLQNKYQIIILIVATCFQVFTNMITVSLPFLERTTTILVYDESLNKTTEVPFTYDYCDKQVGNVFLNHTNYRIKEVHNSWVYEYNTQCDKAKTGFIGSFSFMGLLVGSLCYSFLADKHGRRLTILLGSVSCIVILFLFNFAAHLYIVYALVFLLQTFAMFILLGNFNYSAEISAKESRALYGAIINGGDAIAGISFTLLFKFINSWRLIFNICAVLYLICTVFYAWFSVESPQFYFAKGQTKEIYESLEYIAKINEREFSVNEENTDEEKELKGSDSTQENTVNNQPQENLIAKYSVFDLVKYPSVRYNFILMNFVWFTSSGMLFTILISLKNLSGNIYKNSILFGLVDVLSCIVVGVIIETVIFGRKRTMILFFIICLASGLCLLLLNNPVAQNIISMISYFCVAGIFTTCFVYSSEVYPTPLSAKGLSINTLFGFSSSIVFPFVLEYMGNQIFIIFTGLSFICSICLFFITETHGKAVDLDIAEEIEEQLISKKINS